MANPVLQIEGLTKTYHQRGDDPVQAVQGIDLSIDGGQVFGFLGPNGAGKTTTIKMLCSLVKPTGGRALINGFDVWQQRSQAMRQVGAVLEGTRNIHWPLSAWNNLLYFGHLKGLSGRRLLQRAENLLRELSLWDRKDHLVRTYSRGMQQKVAIGCALIADPPILLLDEPTLGLDVQAARSVKELIHDLAVRHGKTIVLTTHQLHLAQELCERLAIISRGRIITHQRTTELLALFREEYYLIKVKGCLPETEKAKYPTLSILEEGEQTHLSGSIIGQDELYKLLDRMHELGLPLISASLVEPDLEDIFVRLLDSDGGEEVGQ